MADAPAEPPSTSAAPVDAPPAIREEQVRSAVAFLSHPKVQASPISSKRAFLERKGLTSAELAEAFNRVPESAPASAQQYAPATPTNQQQQGQLMPTNSPPQVLAPYAGPAMPPPPAAGVRWTQVLLGASAVAAGAWAIKQLAGPYLSDLYHRLLPGSSQEDDKAPSPEQAALAAASAELKQSVEALMEVAQSLQQPGGGGSAGVDVAEEVRRELREFAGMLQRTAGGRAQASDTAELRREVEALKAALQEATRPGGGAQEPFRQAPTAAAQQWGSNRASGAAAGLLAGASQLDYQARPFAPSNRWPTSVPFSGASRAAPTTCAPFSPSPHEFVHQQPSPLPQQPPSPPRSEAAAPAFGQPSRLPTPSTPPTTAPSCLPPQPQAGAPQPSYPPSIPRNTGPVGGVSYPDPSAVSDPAAGASSSFQAGSPSAADVAQPSPEAAKVMLPDISMGWTGAGSESPSPPPSAS